MNHHHSLDEFPKKIYSRESFMIKPISFYSHKILEKAEKLYGKRVNIFEYDGIEACDTVAGISPLIDEENNIKVRIQIPMEIIHESESTVMTMGQQLFHVLCYDGKTQPNVLQTGGAVEFADIFYTHTYKDPKYVSEKLLYTKNYIHLLDPYKAVKKLIRNQPNAILRLREIQPVMGKITKKDFITAGIKVEPLLLNYLLSPFSGNV